MDGERPDPAIKGHRAFGYYRPQCATGQTWSKRARRRSRCSDPRASYAMIHTSAFKGRFPLLQASLSTQEFGSASPCRGNQRSSRTRTYSAMAVTAYGFVRRAASERRDCRTLSLSVSGPPLTMTCASSGLQTESCALDLGWAAMARQAPRTHRWRWQQAENNRELLPPAC